VRPPLGLNNQRFIELLPRGCAPEKLGHNGGTAFLAGYQKSLYHSGRPRWGRFLAPISAV